MKPTRRAWIPALLAGALALASFVDGARAADSPYVAPKDMAYIVFVKAGSRGSRKAAYTFYEKDLTCLSVMDDAQAEIIPVKPGKHTIYTMSTNAHRMEFNVEAGRTYFVRISMPRYGYGTIKLVPAKRGTETFGQVKEWVDGVKVSDPNKDICRGHKLEADKKGRNRAEERIPDADNKWKQSAEYREKLTMKKSDGFTREEAAKL